MTAISGKELNELLRDSDYHETYSYLVANGRSPTLILPDNPYIDLILKGNESEVLKTPKDPTQYNVLQYLQYFDPQKVTPEILRWLGQGEFLNIPLEIVRCNPDVESFPNHLWKIMMERLKVHHLYNVNGIVGRVEFWEHLPQKYVGKLLKYCAENDLTTFIPSNVLQKYLLSAPEDMGDIIAKYGKHLTSYHICTIVAKYPQTMQYFDAHELDEHDLGELLLEHPFLIRELDITIPHSHAARFVRNYAEYAEDHIDKLPLSDEVLDACIDNGFHLLDIYLRPLLEKGINAHINVSKLTQLIQNYPKIRDMITTESDIVLQAAAHKAGRHISALNRGLLIPYLLAS
ncbi:hypothetical protein KDA11_00090 [Candidatus Saccharibacteria bacterium]|nr:hypothetical protein [Candidatus Saccharibacteria bacterium]